MEDTEKGRRLRRGGYEEKEGRRKAVNSVKGGRHDLRRQLEEWEELVREEWDGMVEGDRGSKWRRGRSEEKIQ